MEKHRQAKPSQTTFVGGGVAPEKISNNIEKDGARQNLKKKCFSKMMGGHKKNRQQFVEKELRWGGHFLKSPRMVNVPWA